MLRQQFITTLVSTDSEQLIIEKVIEQRDDDIVISCDGGERLVEVDKQFGHSEMPGDILVVTSSRHQGKYLCIGESRYPSVIYYIQLSGT